MDIVNILTQAIDRLPTGDHSTGLDAVLRHVVAAIRHFDRKDGHESDTFTDAIYRTNQAFEGSLKEAYRVLTAQDPSGKSTYEIENYLENNGLIRPRVLKQLTRYRQDYRNPSTHDYKLDFDENEALLAILSVAAFSKLLVDQISSKIAYNNASSLTPASLTLLKSSSIKSIGQLRDFITTTAIAAASEIPQDNDVSSDEFDGILAGTLVSHGINAELIFSQDNESNGYHWDILVSHESFKVAIETRWGTSSSYDLDTAVGFIFSGLNSNDRIDAAILIARADDGDPYIAYDAKSKNGESIRIVTRSNDIELKESTAKLRNLEFSRWNTPK